MLLFGLIGCVTVLTVLGRQHRMVGQRTDRRRIGRSTERSGKGFALNGRHKAGRGPVDAEPCPSPRTVTVDHQAAGTVEV